MSLDALAPDQRAVVQLVLQQDRSYEDLAGLLGISESAVRERAHKGLAALASTSGIGADEHAAIADYLLGQQSVSEREATRALLSRSAAARDWAGDVAGELQPVARHPLPAIPAAPAPAPEPAVEPEPEPVAAAAAAAQPREPRPRSRPRPRPSTAAHEETPEPDATSRPAGAAPKPRRDRLGGALLIGGIAILLVAGIILLLTRGGDDDKSSTASTKAGATATPTATATAQFQPLGQLSLKSPTGGKAKGQMVIFANSNGGIAFTLQGTDVPASGNNEAYAVWLTGGDKPHRLGFAPQVKADGKLGTSGPRDQDATNFAKWFSQSKNVVVSRETSEDATSPGPVVLQGSIPTGTKSGSSGG